MIFTLAFCFGAQGQILSSSKIIWNEAIKSQSNTVYLMLAAKPFQQRLILGGEMVAPGIGFLYTTNNGYLLELKVANNTNELNGDSKVVWRYFNEKLPLVGQEEFKVTATLLDDESGLALVLYSGNLGSSPSIHLIDFHSSAEEIQESITMTNKPVLHPPDLSNSIDLDQFEDWRERFEKRVGIVSAKKRNDIVTLAVTNAAGKSFKFSNPEGQWHAYSFWGEINRVKK